MSSSNSPASAGPSRWRRRLGISFLIVVAVLLSAPFVIAHTPLRNWVLSRAVAGMPLTIHAGGMTLNWVRPVELLDVVVRDAAGETIASAKSIRTERTLVGLLWNLRSPGTVRVDDAEITIVLHPDGSSLEKLIADFPEGDGSAPAAPMRLALAASGTTVRILDSESNRKWTIDAPEIDVAVNESEGKPIQAKIRAALNGEPGTLEADLSMQDDGGGALKAKLEAWPIAMATPLLRRFHAGLVLDGKLEGNASGAWKRSGDAVSGEFDGELRGRDFAASGSLLGEDRIALAAWKAPVRCRLDGSRLTIEKSELVSDVGAASLAGTIDFNRELRAHLEDAGWAVSANVDVAKLVKLAPNAFRLRKDVAVDSGSIAFEAKSAKRDADTVWQASLKTTPLRGSRAGQQIVWPEPIAFDVRARNLHRRIPTVESIRCDSSFFAISGKATETEAVVQANVDLEKLAAPLSQFVELGTSELAGKAQGWIRAAFKGDQGFEVDGSASLDRLRIEFGAGRGVREDQLALELRAKGIFAKDGTRRFDEGFAQVKSGGGTLELQLREPFSDAAKGPSGSWYVKLQGELADWQRRALPFVSALHDWKLEGAVDGQAWIKATDEGIDCQSLVLSAKNFGCVGPMLAIRNEPQFDVQGSGSWRSAGGTIELGKTKLHAAALDAFTPQFVVRAAKGTAEGTVEFAGDLARLQRWLTPLAGLAPLAGDASGKAEIHTDNARVAFTLGAKVKNLSCGSAGSEPYREPLASVEGSGDFDFAKDRIRVASFKVQGRFLAAEATGSLADLHGKCELALEGKATYDLETIEPLLKPYLGPTGRIQGRDTRTFRVSGPLVSRTDPKGPAAFDLSALTGEASATWTLLAAQGAQVGPTEIKTVLRQGWVQAYPIETTVNGGRLKMQPNLRLAPMPMEAVLAPNATLENAKLTPAMFAGLLGDVLPLLAHATSAEGELSLALQNARVPLADVKQTEAAGILTLHHARVGPGPLAQELAGLMKIPAPYSIVKENKIAFRVAKGRIYHENLELLFPDDMLLRTSGSVGMDGSLDLLVDAPIPPKLVGGLRLPDQFAKMRVKIPVTGTAAKPRVDPRALQDIVAQILRNPLNLIPTSNPGGGIPLPKLGDLIRPKGD